MPSVQSVICYDDLLALNILEGLQSLIHVDLNLLKQVVASCGCSRIVRQTLFMYGIAPLGQILINTTHINNTQPVLMMF